MLAMVSEVGDTRAQAVDDFPEKAPRYEPPRLVRFGTLAEITKSGNVEGFDDLADPRTAQS